MQPVIDLAAMITTERVMLERQRTRLDQRLDLLLEIEAAVGRYQSLCPGDAPQWGTEASRTGDEPLAGTGLPDGPVALPGASTTTQDADCGARGAVRTAEVASPVLDGPDDVTRVLAAPTGQQECERCGRPYEPRKLGGQRQRYCTPACRRQADLDRRMLEAPGLTSAGKTPITEERQPAATRECERCGNTFPVRAGFAKRFCSGACRKLAHEERRKESAREADPGPDPRLTSVSKTGLERANPRVERPFVGDARHDDPRSDVGALAPVSLPWQSRGEL